MDIHEVEDVFDESESKGYECGIYKPSTHRIGKGQAAWNESEVLRGFLKQSYNDIIEDDRSNPCDIESGGLRFRDLVTEDTEARKQLVQSEIRECEEAQEHEIRSIGTERRGESVSEREPEEQHERSHDQDAGEDGEEDP